MPADLHCDKCEEIISFNSKFCSHCGAGVNNEDIKTTGPQHKSARVALFLSIFFGILGAHRFYVGKIGTGILMLITAGGLGIWLIVDIVLIATNKFDDKNNQTLILFHKPTPIKKILTTLGALILSFALFASIVIITVFHITGSLINVVDKQLSALRSGNITLAYSYTSKAFQENTSIKRFEAFARQNPSLGNNKRATFTERKIYNNRGKLKGTLVSQNGTTTPTIFYLIKEHGSWKIYHIRIYPSGIDRNAYHKLRDSRH